MTGKKAMRWVTALATVVLGVAIAIGVALVLAWHSLPLDRATIVINGETVALPSLSGGQAALAIALAAFAVLIAAIVVVGGVAIALASALFGIAIAGLVAVLTVLLVASPVLVLGWVVWRIVRSPSPAGAQPRLA